jgi:hypothetical protein
VSWDVMWSVVKWTGLCVRLPVVVAIKIDLSLVCYPIVGVTT